MDQKTEVPVGTEQPSPLAAQPEAMGGGLLPATPPKVETGVGVPPSAPEAAAQAEKIQLSPTEMDAAMRQGAIEGKAVLEAAPADVAANALSGNELLKTPGQPELNATHQQMVAQKVEASQTPQRLPIHRRILGAMGFGGSKTEAPTAAVTPDHLVANADGKLETPQMPNFGQAGTESASIATQAGETTQGQATAGQAAAGSTESAASALGEMTAITPPPVAETASPVAEVAAPPAVDATEAETEETEETVSATAASPEAAVATAETPAAVVTTSEETEEATEMTSPDPAGGLDIERSATPLPARGVLEGADSTSSTTTEAAEEAEEDHPDPLAVPQPLSPTAMAGVEGALEKAGAENLGGTPADNSGTGGLPTPGEAVAGAEQIVSNAQNTGELPVASPMPEAEVEESPTNPAELPQPAASNVDAPLNPQAMADINNALGASADSLGTPAATAPGEGLSGVSNTAGNGSEALATGGADMLGTTPSAPTVSETAEDGLDASAAVAEAGNIVTGQSISGASPSSTPSEDQGNSGAGAPPTPVTA